MRVRASVFGRDREEPQLQENSVMVAEGGSHVRLRLCVLFEPCPSATEDSLHEQIRYRYPPNAPMDSVTRDMGIAQATLLFTS